MVWTGRRGGDRTGLHRGVGHTAHAAHDDLQREVREEQPDHHQHQPTAKAPAHEDSNKSVPSQAEIASARTRPRVQLARRGPGAQRVCGPVPPAEQEHLAVLWPCLAV